MVAVLKYELRITGGARAGHREAFEKPYVGIGRHPMSDLRFDAEQDIDASTRHAAIVKDGDQFVLRDLGSTNGTFVNGKKLVDDHPLKDGDALRFGVHGPEVSFHLMREEGEEVIMPAVHIEPRPDKPKRDIPATISEAAQPRTPATKPAPGVRETPSPSKTGILRAEIAAERTRSRSLIAALAIVALGSLGVVYWLAARSNQQIRTVEANLDSMSRELSALRILQTRSDSQKSALELALRQEQDPTRQNALRGQIAVATRRSAAIQEAQEVDYTAIRRANDPAVAFLWARFSSDSMEALTGTAFSVNSNGQMLTNRHVVMKDGERAAEIAIRFSGSRDVHPARLVRVSPDADIALVQLESAGPFPAVSGIATGPVAEGAPIVLLGYPGGGTRATLVTGSVARVVPDSLIELDAFSGVGASGSPIFDRDGKVIGIEFGGLAGSDGRSILGLPIARAMRLLQ